MARKTVSVETIKRWCNNILNHPEKEIHGMVLGLTPEQAYRKATAAILEAVLHESGNYKGFSYIGLDEAVLNGGMTFAEWIESGGDETRRSYS